MKNSNKKIAIIGLGYVGLPLALAFSKKFETIGFDINSKRIEELKGGIDKTNEIPNDELIKNKKINFTAELDEIRSANIYIITVPTPINKNDQPDLTAIKSATESVGSILKKDDIVVYESTVYPGLTEEICVPILESISGLSSNIDFFYGYSPERINPGDSTHRLADIVKVTSGSNNYALDVIDNLYDSIITAGTHRASSVRVAEAAKVIENIQRDVNIALINELSIIFKKMGINTEEVLEASGTKWNFHEYRPGLVGGHCIGVDPHYLSYKSKSIGIEPRMINAGREINEKMSLLVADEIMSLMNVSKIDLETAKVLILGFSFKADCPDSRNTKVADLYEKLLKSVNQVDIYDPLNDSGEVMREYDIELKNYLKDRYYDCVIIAVGHDEFNKMGIDGIKKLCKKNHVLYDLSYNFNPKDVTGRL